MMASLSGVPAADKEKAILARPLDRLTLLDFDKFY